MEDLDLGATVKGFVAGQKLFGRYTLRKILGRGGMGVVWLARDEELGRDAALKFLPEMVASDRAAIDDLKREVRRAIALAHPHIVKIHDFVTDGRTAAVSMEYLDGDTLSSLRLDEPGRVFPLAKLAPWVRQLCGALDYAHGKVRVVHRDLKPANLMIDHDGDLKVLDFGIAASLSDSVSRVSQQAGSSGTPLYMSPQQMMGEDPAVTDDVYSLGATLYELLSGKPPFHTGSIVEQVRVKVPALLNERRKANGVEQPPLPAEWETTIAACLAKEPADRPQSAGEIAERLGLTGATVAVVAGKREQGVGSRAEPKTSPATVTGVERRAPNTLAASQEAAPATKRAGPNSVLYAALVAGAILLAGAGYYFGIYLPEQGRQKEVRRLEAQARTEADAKEQARQEAETLKRKADEERAAADAKARSEQARLTAEHLAAARGGIVIRTDPTGAEVRVGAVALDKSPLTLKDQKLGKYPVKIRAEGYEDWNGEVEVKENEFSDLDVKLTRSTGSLRVTSLPAGIDVLVDGTKYRTPLNLSSVPTGAHELVFARPGWPEVRQSVTVNRNDRAEIRQDQVGGSLAIVSTPAGAEVWVRGSRVGVTPINLQGQPPGSAEIEVRHKGFATAKRTVEFVPGRQAEGWNVALKEGGYLKGRPDFSRGPTRMRLKFTGVISGTTKFQNSGESEYEYSDLGDDGMWNRITDRVIQSSSGVGAQYDYVSGTTFQFWRASSGQWSGRLVSGGFANGGYKAEYDKFLSPASGLVWLGSEECWPTNDIAVGGSWSVPVSIRNFPMLGNVAELKGTITGHLEKLAEDSAEIRYDFDVTGRNMNVDLVFRYSGVLQVRVNLAEHYISWASAHFRQDGDTIHNESTLESEVLSFALPSPGITVPGVSRAR